MKPQEHIIATIPLATALALIYNDLYTGLIAMAAGILIDIDHFIEYFIVERDFNIGKFYQNCMTGLQGHKRIILIMHSWELLFILWVLYLFTPSPFLLAVFSSFTLHIVLDQAFNNVKPCTYFLIYRIIRGFDRECFFQDIEKEENGVIY